jgi:hypothetical protein
MPPDRTGMAPLELIARHGIFSLRQQTHPLVATSLKLEGHYVM